ncbi:P22 phage major capsid protein family protein [Phenylobacterium sp.]|uniref:P22 phage major capsid protein family protein n=1 Tax=Phenylobacterium sp. TaxID=1871053 RepID=UPI002FC71BD6
MTNTLLTSTMVTRKALKILHQKLNFVGSITREYDDSFANTGAKIGDSLKIRLPNRYTVRTGKTLQAQDTVEASETLTVGTQKGVDMNFSSAELTLSIDDFSERVIEPAMSVLAAGIEADALSMYKDVYNQVNNQGSAATFAKVLAGRKQLVDNLIPPGDRHVVLNTQDNVDMVDGLKALFNDQTSLAKQFREGYLGRTAGFDFSENTLLPSHARGAENTAYTTDTTTAQMPSSATALSTLTFASGSGAGVKGDIFTIAGVYRVHPETKVSTGVLQQFALTADIASGATTGIGITPAIVTSGPRQNVTVTTTSATAATTWAGTASTNYGVSLAYHKSAFALATADLVMPKGVDFGAREVFDGISLRIVRQYDINNDNLPCRVDVLYGYKTIRPQLATRLANN